jgi:hypothetical protein
MQADALPRAADAHVGCIGTRQMARKEQAEKLLRKGLYPSQIASEMGVSAGTVIQYLRTRVGEGALRLSDIYFAFPAEKRNVLRQALVQEPKRGYIDYRGLQEHGVAREDADLFKSLQRGRVFAGDMYEYISDIEMTIHQMVRHTLESQFGGQENGWWRQGISEDIRRKCATRREEDAEPCDSPFAYTDMIDLSKIILKNWGLFQNNVPQAYGINRKVLETDFVRLNTIRNSVMHPVKQRDWSEDDFQFVKNVRERFLTHGSTQQPARGDAEDRAPQP